eukprot:2468498-Prymnesium_polylepis.1
MSAWQRVPAQPTHTLGTPSYTRIVAPTTHQVKYTNSILQCETGSPLLTGWEPAGPRRGTLSRDTRAVCRKTHSTSAPSRK